MTFCCLFASVCVSYSDWFLPLRWKVCQIPTFASKSRYYFISTSVAGAVGGRRKNGYKWKRSWKKWWIGRVFKCYSVHLHSCLRISSPSLAQLIFALRDEKSQNFDDGILAFCRSGERTEETGFIWKKVIKMLNHTVFSHSHWVYPHSFWIVYSPLLAQPSTPKPHRPQSPAQRTVTTPLAASASALLSPRQLFWTILIQMLRICGRT